MKHKEKLDLVLRTLYTLGIDKKDQLLREVCDSNHIPLTSDDELYLIAKRLEDDGFIRCVRISAGIYASLTSAGIEYCEEDSYAYKGQPLISNNYNLNIINSSHANIISSSNNVSIASNNQVDIENKIKEFKIVINNDGNISSVEKQDIIDCLEEVEANIEAGRKSKFAFKHLVELASNVAGVGSLLLNLGQLMS
ncbi:hypothetical protein ACW9KT_21530 [Hymenobacter sp. HD11105]